MWDLGSVSWIAVVVAAVSTFILGALWYGPLFGKAWMRASGMTEEKAGKANRPLTFGLAFVFAFLAATVLDMFIGPAASWGSGLWAGGVVGLFWVATSFGVVYLFEQRSFAHLAVNAGYHVVSFMIMGAILGIW